MSNHVCQCLCGLRLLSRNPKSILELSRNASTIGRSRIGVWSRHFSINTSRLAKAGRSLPKPAPPAPVRSVPVSGSGAVPSGTASRLERFFISGDRILLYKSSSHTAFYIYSYLAGGGLIFGAYNFAAVVLQPLPGEETPRPLPKWVRYLTVGTAVFISAFGAAILVAPFRLLKSITAIAKRPAGSNVIQPFLIAEIKSPLPFIIPTKTIEVPASQAFLDQNLAASQMSYASVPLVDAAGFTEHYMKHRDAASSPPTGSFLANVWPRMKYETRRLILREGLARLRFATRGSYKVDLHECELLDDGKPLTLFTTPDLNPGVGAMAALRRWTRD